MKASRTSKRTFAVTIDGEYCKGCNLCLQVCPKKVFSRGEKRSREGYRMPDVSQEGHCSGCLLCEMTCPDLALSVQEVRK